ncbi:GntR family transcriptional regulator [Oceanibium sediminis]|uniref:GntR family transcriptional regulator n=1 Tax=Oceanibium sediminis TaxID=2026339 RepID=UPI000DD35134|nr:GntR family transcriptional regulator [Oceanibium sediminis]
MPEGATLLPGDEAGTARRGARAGLVHDTLRREILALTIAPGAPLDETQLSQRFAMSRSPIREALSRLAAEGLVVMLPNRSTVAAPIELADFPRYIEALMLSQRVCTRLAAERRSDADLAAMQAAADAFDQSVRPRDHLEMSEANKTFHMTIARAARNRYLADTYGALLDQGRRLLHLQFRHLETAENRTPLAEEHHHMVAAIAARDADRADHLAQVHAEGFQRRLLDFLGKVGTSDFPLPDAPPPACHP